MKKIKLKKITNSILIFIFLGIITIPLLKFNTDPQKTSRVLNRVLAKKPQLGGGGGVNVSEYINSFNTYVNENIGFREEATIFYISKMYQYFEKVEIDSYTKGKDGHLFLTSDSRIAAFQGKDLFTPDELERFNTAVQKTNDFFESTGAKFYFTIIPSKEQIYPEYYPEGILNYSSYSKLDQLIEYLQKSHSNVFGLKKPLLDQKEKSEELLYYKTYDTAHWNLNGALVGYQEIMKRFKKDFPQLTIRSKEDLIIETEKFTGSIVYLRTIDEINEAYKLEDNIYHYTFKPPMQELVKTEEFPEEMKADNLQPYEYQHYINKSNPNLPKILIMGDSYIWMTLLPLFSESFSELYFIGTAHSMNAETIVNLQKEIKADVVLYEKSEQAFTYPRDLEELEKFADFK